MRKRKKIENTDARTSTDNAMGSPTNARVMGDTTDPGMGEIANARKPRFSPGSSEDPSTGESIEPDYTFPRSPGSQLSVTENTGVVDDAFLDWSTMLNVGLENNYGFDERCTAGILGMQQDTESGLPQEQLSRINQGYPQASSLPSFPRTTNGLNTPRFESGYHETPLSPSSSTHNSRQFPFPTPATAIPPQTTALDNGRNSQCVIACSQIISSLEKYQLDNLKVLDLILGIVKRVTERLDSLVDGQFEFPNSKCLNLFNIILYQLVEILEVGCADFLTATANTPGSLSSSEILEAGFHDFDFGGLGIGYKDQERLRSQVILEVLRPVINIMQKVFFISTKAGLDRDSCYQAREGRLKSLVEKLKKRSGGGGMVMRLSRRGDTAIY